MTRTCLKPTIVPDDGVVDPLVVTYLALGIPTSCTPREKRITADLLDTEGATQTSISVFTGSSGTTIRRWLTPHRTHPCRNHPAGHRYPESVEVCEALPMALPIPKEVPA